MIHNPNAGCGEPESRTLVALIEKSGYAVSYFSSKEHSVAEILQRPSDLIVVAGGDGTFRKVARKADTGGPPIALLPLGTANNIAKSLGIAGTPKEIVNSWRQAQESAYYPMRAEGEWGSRRLIEGLGCGAIARAIDAMSDDTVEPNTARQRLWSFVADAAPIELDLICDGVRVSGEFVAVEIISIPLVGPHLLLAPQADPSDRRVEVVCVPASATEQRRFAEWLATGSHDNPAPAWTSTATSLSLEGRLSRVRLDDKARKLKSKGISKVLVDVEPEAVRVLVSPTDSAHK